MQRRHMATGTMHSSSSSSGFRRLRGARHAMLLLFTLGLALSSLACSRDPNQCQDQSECFLGERCVQDVCVGYSDRFEDGLDMTLVAEMDRDASAFMEDAGRDAGTPCVNDAMCSPGFRCDTTAGECIEQGVSPMPECAFERPCQGAARACVEGRCVEDVCATDEACGLGRVCSGDGSCAQPAWDLNLTDERGDSMPGELLLSVGPDAQADAFELLSERLRVFSNTNAQQSVSVVITPPQDSRQESPFLDGSCTAKLELCMDQTDTQETKCSELEHIEASAEALRWSRHDMPLLAGEHSLELQVHVVCNETSSSMTAGGVLFQSQKKMSLEYKRLPGEVVKGFVLTLLVND